MLVLPLPGAFTAVNAVGHGVLRPIQRGRAECARRFFVGGARTLDVPLHPRRADVGHRRKQQTQDRQTPVVCQKHHRVAHQRHAGVEDLSGEFPHSLHAVVHVGDGLGHQLARALLLQRRPASAHQIGVQDALHPAVDVVGEAADIEPLDKPRGLHPQRDENIGKHQNRHFPGGGISAQNVRKALRQPPFKPWRGKKTDVVDQAGKGHKCQRQPFDAEIRTDPVRAEGFFTFHPRFSPFAA